MNYKCIIGLITFVAGVFLMGFAIDAMREIESAKGFAKDFENFFQNNPTWNPIIKFFGGKAQEEAAKYDMPAMISLISGIVLTVAGAVVAIIYRRKR